MKDCYSHCSGSGLETKPDEFTGEHDTVKSRLSGKDHQIAFGPMGAAPNPAYGGKTPANPFMSLAQSHYMHAHPEILGSKIKEWDSATDYSHLPKKVKK